MKQATTATGQVSEPYRTASEISVMLGVSDQWLTKHKEIPRHRVGMFVRYLESEVKAFLAKQ